MSEPTATRSGPKVKRARSSRTVRKTAGGVRPDIASVGDGVGELATRNTLAVNPLIGIRASDFGEAGKALARLVLKTPLRTGHHVAKFAGALKAVVVGRSELTVDPKDKRFADPAWSSSPVHRRLVQAHMAASQELGAYIANSQLNERDKARAQLAASLLIDALAPSNTLLHPAALKRAIDTGGTSLVKGAKNLIHDLRHNNGLPSSVDKTKFKLGHNLALTPGKVVFKSAVLELIQYQPTTPQVYARPLLVCSPQVNKFYAMDLSPEKSLFRFAVGQGIQTFAISWFNPTLAQRDWDMSTYIQAVDEAVDAVRQITGSPDISLWGACSGGMTTAAYLGWLAAIGEQGKVVNITSPVCVLDPTRTQDTTMGLLSSPEGLVAVKAAVRRRGLVDGSELARVFAWLRPNDLIWNYWVNNYLMGNDPPAFDVLFWNADTTRLPAAFHADLIRVFEVNPYVQAGQMTVLGEALDMRKVAVNAYIVAGITDHITPWKACYDTARIYGQGSQFVLANAGHLQSILNPPGVPKSFFFSGHAESTDAEIWSQSAVRHDGSWWPHWMQWLQDRSGELKPAPRKLGSRKHIATVNAPGDYVLLA